MNLSVNEESNQSEAELKGIRSRRYQPVKEVLREPDHIIGIKGRGRGRKYLVQWKNTNENEKTWETAASLQQYPKFFFEFKKNQKFMRLKVFHDDDDEFGENEGEQTVSVRESEKSDLTKMSKSKDQLFDNNDKQPVESYDRDYNNQSTKPNESRENRPHQKQNFRLYNPLDDDNNQQAFVYPDKIFQRNSNDNLKAYGKLVNHTDNRSILRNFSLIVNPSQDNPSKRFQEDNRQSNRNQMDNEDLAQKTNAGDQQQPSTSTRLIPSHAKNHENDLHYKSKLSKRSMLQKPPSSISQSQLIENQALATENFPMQIHDYEQSDRSPSKSSLDDLMIQTATGIIGHVIFQKMMFFRLEWNQEPPHKNIELKYYPYSRVYRMNSEILAEYVQKYLTTGGMKMPRIDPQ
jgi:hypothetical protein